MKAPSQTICNALLAFAARGVAARGGSGVIDKGGGLVASGKRLDYDPVTWLRLVVEGQLYAAGTFRLEITPQEWRNVETLKKRRGLRMSPRRSSPRPAPRARLCSTRKIRVSAVVLVLALLAAVMVASGLPHPVRERARGHCRLPRPHQRRRLDMAEIDNLLSDLLEDVACAAEAAFCTGTGEFVYASFRSILSERNMLTYALKSFTPTPLW